MFGGFFCNDLGGERAADKRSFVRLTSVSIATPLKHFGDVTTFKLKLSLTAFCLVGSHELLNL